ncbi:MAG: 3'-5' exonuclease [Candidatus Doudnabacteria bacterium]|nr:3'-5' exonuclease [Candidatus Doudnabacteria bacterium]
MDKMKYCSLDIETTGFDPAKDEILEIGFIFFSFGKNGIKLGEEYTRVFKSQREVSETILALTGITKTELESADAFAEHREEIQEQLKDVILVGHNIGFDIKFLEGLGLKFSSQAIDTLDLVQFVLPTHILDFKSQPAKAKTPAVKNKSMQSYLNITLKDKTFYNFRLGVNMLAVTAVSLKELKSKSLLVMPQSWQAMDLWKQGICDSVFVQDQMFNETAFERLKSKKDLSPDELKFVLKILVWFHTNWQNQNISDLNLSFFGGQFRHLIAGSETKERPQTKFLACDLSAFLEFREKGWYKNRKAVFFGLAEMERALSDNIGEKLSWSHISYLLLSCPQSRACFTAVRLI